MDTVEVTCRIQGVLLITTAVVSINHFVCARPLTSWRPVKVGKVKIGYSIDFFSKDGRTALIVPRDYSEREYILDIRSGKTTRWPDQKTTAWLDTAWPDNEGNFSRTSPEFVVLLKKTSALAELRVREVHSGRLMRTFRCPTKGQVDFFLGLDGETVGLVNDIWENPLLLQWNIKSGKLLRRVALKSAFAGEQHVFGYAIASNGRQIIGLAEGLGIIWDGRSDAQIRSWTTNASGIPLFLSPDARTIVYTGFTQTSPASYKFVDTSNGHMNWKTDGIASGVSVWNDEIMLPKKANCEVRKIFSGRLVRQLPSPRLQDGQILRVTRDFIYTLNAKNEVFRWRAR